MDFIEKKGPIEPRKRPQQQRSRLLFQSVKEACLKILDEEGVDQLTVKHLAEVAGVAVGSLYQYFPNVEAVLSELYMDQLRQHNAYSSSTFRENSAGVPLEQAIRTMIDTAIGYHRKMLALNSEFYQKYHYHFRLRNDELEKGDHEPPFEGPLGELLRAHQQQRGISAPEMKCFLLMEMLFAALQRALDQHPEYFTDPEFSESLYRLCMAVIAPQL